MLNRAVAVLVAVSIVTACSGDGGPVDRAQRVLEDDDRFDTSFDAGDALADVGAILLNAGRRCDTGCDALLSASAFAQVLAVRVLDCTAPGRFDAREAMSIYLDAVERVADTAPAPEPPPPPDCHR